MMAGGAHSVITNLSVGQADDACPDLTSWLHLEWWYVCRPARVPA
jgi:hypothetical protein